MVKLVDNHIFFQKPFGNQIGNTTFEPLTETLFSEMKKRYLDLLETSIRQESIKSLIANHSNFKNSL